MVSLAKRWRKVYRWRSDSLRAWEGIVMALLRRWRVLVSLATVWASAGPWALIPASGQIPRIGVDDEQHNERLHQSAERGNPLAQFCLDWMHENGRAVPQDDLEAVKSYRKAAERGYAPAQTHLGWMYDEGRGVPQNDAEAAKWYRKAAEQNDAYAQSSLGWMYREGTGVVRDDVEAVKWLRKAAEQNEPYAQNNLGLMYEEGRGVPQDDAEAAKWYRKAAEQNHSLAQSNLGWFYREGRGVPQDDAEAVKWIRKAVEQNETSAQHKLGVMYAQGRGVPQDHAEAVMWLRKAVGQGDERAKRDLVLLEKAGFLLHMRTALFVVLFAAVVVFGSLFAYRIVTSFAQNGENLANGVSDAFGDDREIDREVEDTRVPGVSTTRVVVSTTLLGVGLATGAVGSQQISGFTSYLGTANALFLGFLGITLFCAGALCPFRRTVTGILAGLALSLLWLFSM
jgi:TPR repeat protein